MFINPFTIKNNLKKMITKKLTKILVKTGLSIFSWAFSAQAAAQDLNISPFYSYFFNYDSVKVNLLDRNKDKKIDKIDYICYLSKGETIRGQSQDDNFDEHFEFGKYKSFNKEGLLERAGDFSLNFLSKAVKNYSAGAHKFYKK